VTALPPFLRHVEILEDLTGLLVETHRLHQTLKIKAFGPRVTDSEEAHRLLARVVKSFLRMLALDGLEESMPDLILTRRLGDLNRHTARAYLFFLPLVLIFVGLGVTQAWRGFPLHLLVGSSLFLLALPILVRRRTRIHIEHQCGYGGDGGARGVIVIDQLPSIQFQSYLAHEYAHHVHSLIREKPGEAWMREGWARLVQWKISWDLYRQEGDPAYLHHALVQIIGELKFACELIAAALERKLPGKVRRIPTIYHTNPLFNLLTGTPSTSYGGLLVHAVGTAAYLLAEKRWGFEAAIHEDPYTLFSAENISPHCVFRPRSIGER